MSWKAEEFECLECGCKLTRDEGEYEVYDEEDNDAYGTADGWICVGCRYP